MKDKRIYESFTSDTPGPQGKREVEFAAAQFQRNKYAQERGGWKSDKVMKGVYMQTFSEERIRVDDIMDSYFEEIMQHEIQHGIQKAQ